MQPLDLRYTLTIDGTDYVLPHAPTGWEESLVRVARSEKYFGMQRFFSVPMEFVVDGAWLLRREFYAKGLNARADIKIERLANKYWSYRTVFLGSLDFSTFKDKDRTGVEITAMDRGITEIVKAFENVQYEIPFTDENSVWLRVPGIGQTENASAITDIVNFAFDFNYFDGGLLSLPGIDIISNGLDSAFVTFQSVDTFSPFGQNLFPTSPRWFLRGEQVSQVVINGRLQGSVTLRNPTQSLFIQVRNDENQVIHTIANFQAFGSGTFIQPFDIPFTFSHQLEVGERLFLIIGVNGTWGPLNSTCSISVGDIFVSNNFVTLDSIVRAMRPFELFKALLKRMNNDIDVPCQSFLLTGDWSRLLITSGDAIRGLANARVKTSFTDFFRSINAVLNCGFGVENNIAVLEPKSYWMRPSLNAGDLGDVKDFTLEPASNFIANTIKVGYRDNEYETDFGREEFNAGQQWATRITRIQKELDLMSPYRADQFGIESVRTLSEQANRDGKDDESDNDTFMVKAQAVPDMDDIYDVEGAEAYRAGDGIQGLSARQSYYNLDLSPKKNLLRHGDYLRGMLHRFEGTLVSPVSADKNTALVTIDLDGRRVAESEPIRVSTLPDPLFMPYVVSFRTQLPKDVVEKMEMYPAGYWTFSYRGDTFQAFVLDVSADVARNSDREWKLLLAPGNDVTRLVR